MQPSVFFHCLLVSTLVTDLVPWTCLDCDLTSPVKELKNKERYTSGNRTHELSKTTPYCQGVRPLSHEVKVNRSPG